MRPRSLSRIIGRVRSSRHWVSGSNEMHRSARNLEIVVYCSFPNEASAATAAKHLKRASLKEIRPLLGGIDPWVQAGQPLERASHRSEEGNDCRSETQTSSRRT